MKLKQFTGSSTPISIWRIKTNWHQSDPFSYPIKVLFINKNAVSPRI